MKEKNGVLIFPCAHCGYTGAPITTLVTFEDLAVGVQRMIEHPEEIEAEDNARVVWVSVLDADTCKDCRELHGKEIELPPGNCTS